MMLPEPVNNKELIMKNFIIITSTVSLIACGGGGESTDTSVPTSTVSTPVTTQSTSSDNLIGLWQHNKLATILSISQTSYTLYQTAGDYCLQVNQQDINKLSEELGEYKLSADKQRIDVDLEDDFESMFYQPLEQLPFSCAEPILPDSEASPSLVFETFWHHFNDSYASFDIRSVNWQMIYDEYVSQVSDSTSPETLQRIITQMLQKFADAHAGVIAKNNVILRSISYSPLQQQLAEELNLNMDNADWMLAVDDKISEAGATIVQKYLSDVELLATDQVIWGKLANGFGYLNLRSMNFDGDRDTDNLLAADAINDALSSRLTEIDHLVIDLRFNLGGNVPAALKVANFIANQSGHAFDISYKHRGVLSKPATISITPINIGFTGNVYVLTSRHTGSAAEAFIYAIKVGNQAQLIGENTRGILAGPSPKTLANGWVAMVPNRVISGPSGEILESVGFAPDTHLPAFTLSDINRKIDGALEHLLTF